MRHCACCGRLIPDTETVFCSRAGLICMRCKNYYAKFVYIGKGEGSEQFQNCVILCSLHCCWFSYW